MGELEKRGLDWHVADDKMRVFGRVREGEPLNLTSEEVISYLRAEGIDAEFDPPSIDSNITNPTPQWFLMAKGTPPQPSAPGDIEFLVDLGNLSGAAVEDESGRVDYKNLKLFEPVEEGQPLVRRLEKVPGVPGSDVFGKIVPAPEGASKPMPIGEGVRLDESGDVAVAAVSGAVFFEKNQLVVKEVFIVSGDVSYRSGNIHYKGAVEIRGDVLSGFEVHAGGDVWVRGIVEAAHITAGGNVTILGGFQAAGRGSIKAGGTIKLGFANEAVLEAGKEIHIRSSLVNSLVTAGELVVVEAFRGGITGGEVRAGKKIQTSNAGSHLGVDTILRIGLDPELVKKIQETEEAMKNLSSTTQAAQNRKRDLLGFLRLLSQWESGEIVVLGAASPGVEIAFPRDLLKINEEQKHSKFSIEEGRIRIDPASAS